MKNNPATSDEAPAFLKDNSGTINAWAMYDWSNSVYALVISSTIFPIYYNNVTNGNGSDIVSFFGFEFVNTALFSYSLSFSFLVIACLSPLLSSVADYTGSKKGFMKFFCYLGAVACAGLFFFTNAEQVEIAIICFSLATIGYTGSIVFYNAYLPIIASPSQHDKVSAKGFALGYLGSVILLLFCIFFIERPDIFSIDTRNSLPVRLTFLLVGLWWIGFSQIPFSKLPKNVFNRNPSGNYLLKGYRELGMVWRELKQHPKLKRFLAAFFFYIMGVQTVMFLAATFGTKELQLDDEFLMLTLLSIEIIAISGAFGFAWASGKLGNITTLRLALVVWLAICIWAYFVSDKWSFLGLGLVVGVVMGGIQALSRSTYAKMLPKTKDHASFFSFYDVAEKLAIVGGTFSFGYLEALTGSMRNSVLPLMLFFLIGSWFLMRVQRAKDYNSL